MDIHVEASTEDINEQSVELASSPTGCEAERPLLDTEEDNSSPEAIETDIQHPFQESASEIIIKVQRGENWPENKNSNDTSDTNKDSGGRIRNAILFVADNFISAFIICPLNILFWQGLWDLLALNVFPDSAALSGWVTYIAGSCGILILSLSQHFVTKHLSVEKLTHWMPGYHIYTYILGCSNVSHWHGVWLLLDHYSGKSALSAWVTFLIGQCCLCLLRTFATAHAPPTLVCVDVDPTFFKHATRFNTKAEQHILYLLDNLFTVIVIHTLVVVYWRGLWALQDIYLYPEDENKSALASLLISYLLHAFFCLLERPFNNLYRTMTSSSRHKTLLYRTLLEQFCLTISNPVNVAGWRGVWMFTHKYLISDSNPNLGWALSHVLGIGGLMLMLSGQSVTLKGCDMDGEAVDVDGCTLPNKYLRYFVCKKQEIIRVHKIDDGILHHQTVEPK